jgi:hypothetical protein
MKIKIQFIRTFEIQWGKFIAMNAHIKKSERSQINNLIIHFKILEKQE